VTRVSPLPDIEAMLERQVRSWEIRRRLAEKGGQDSIEAMAHLPEGPWLTVSSPLGSGGLELARALARALDWQVFDREILSTISEHTHTQEAVLAHLDEHAMGPVNEYLARLLDPRIPGQAPFRRETVRVIWGLAKQGNAIILGRGANWFLDPRFGVRVRAVASMDVRVERITAREGIDAAAARERAVTRDAQQAGFIRQVYDRDINDPVGYDLVLNLGHLDEETAVHLALTALRRRLGSGS
jgi:cytidylate kinase